MFILSSHYLPCLHWFYILLNKKPSIIDVYEFYTKQTYRNRCTILTANGPLDLIIPVKKHVKGTPMCSIQIENEFRWQHQHWYAIESAYQSSPYYLYYSDGFKKFYNTPYTSLVKWNMDLLLHSLSLMKVDLELKLSEQYSEALTNDIDLRGEVSPKKLGLFQTLPYSQVFSQKFPFQENLSMLDLLFNHGPRWPEYLNPTLTTTN